MTLTIDFRRSRAPRMSLHQCQSQGLKRSPPPRTETNQAPRGAFRSGVGESPSLRQQQPSSRETRRTDSKKPASDDEDGEREDARRRDPDTDHEDEDGIRKPRHDPLWRSVTLSQNGTGETTFVFTVVYVCGGILVN